MTKGPSSPLLRQMITVGDVRTKLRADNPELSGTLTDEQIARVTEQLQALAELIWHHSRRNPATGRRSHRLPGAVAQTHLN